MTMLQSTPAIEDTPALSGDTATGQDSPAPEPSSRPRALVWRAAVLIYAALILLFLFDVKSDIVVAVAGSLPLRIYGVLVAAYLVSRMVFALCYRPSTARVDDADLPHVVAVVPAFNEQERIAATIDSLYALDYPSDRLSVVVIDDGSSDATWPNIVRAAGRHPQLDGLRFSRNRGKRAGMAAGLRAGADAEVMLFVDSDSTLAPDALRELVRPFLGRGGENVGVVTGHADVLNASVNLLTRLQQVRYYAAFRVVKAAESIFGAVSCASGCFSAYRTAALREVLAEWENQTFMGRPATFGDDRALTNSVLAAGWRSVYQSTARCGTAAPERWRGFLRQQLRWKKSWSRESLRVLRIAWRWHPAAAAAMYASILFQLAGPFVAVHALVWGPLSAGRNPLLYVIGLHAIAVLYGLFYAFSRRSPAWWGGVIFAFVYTGVLCWQTYWAMLRIRDTGWGTRESTYDDGERLLISETIGAPGACGVPLADDVVRLVPARRPQPGAPTADRSPDGDAETARAWVAGVIALPLSAVPMTLWLLLH